MKQVLSRDNTPIAFNVTGKGPAVILVDGALCHRAFGPSQPLAAALAQKFTVFTYDRRGRGNSGNAAPYSVEREIEDIDALVNHAGGSACVYGISSGAALALEAARRGLAIKKLALYEAPFIVDDTHPPLPDDFLARLYGLLAADRRGDAVKLFMKLVGTPAIFVAIMRFTPVWSKLKAVAHTLPYDIGLLEEYQKGKPLPVGRWASFPSPALVVDGEKSPPWMRSAMTALAQALPNAKHRSLPGQTHMVKPGVLAPVLTEFFAG